ncbi:hypothetical protein ACPA9J_36450 [Pseudomonas aeruginosa]
MRAYSWPGNIRELENVHHTLLICRDGLIRADDLHLSNLRLERGEELARGGPGERRRRALVAAGFPASVRRAGREPPWAGRSALLRAAYRFCHGNQVHTANLLGLSRSVTRTRLIAIGELVVNKRGGQRIDGERAVHGCRSEFRRSGSRRVSASGYSANLPRLSAVPALRHSPKPSRAQ